MNDFLIPIAFFAAVFGIFFLFIRKKERMALLDRGLDPRSFENQNTNFSTLKYGLLLTGVGLGILLANIIVAVGVMDDEPAYFSFVALFGGIALIIDYLIEKNIIRKQKKEKKAEEVFHD
ncbi:MAG TPA: DUF6249 domain-containing protein [Lentimicrobium sp.]|nr:DUF6249 domain-containing protein [Lentimicrobium sp.]